MDSRQATSTTEQFVERYFEPLFVKGVQDFVRVPNTTPGDESYKEQDLQAAIKVSNTQLSRTTQGLSLFTTWMGQERMCSAMVILTR
ncbi:hypothetical protein FGO68_gene489 [Halteria grandinella]|uniref:Uncharacterized protein n=1 Tax=Halteria grandinella TaxID=5974 RepID=A0A8J8P5P6_HALGN|nr:hypothetical protein FGO68_gene489 [Halteria grandinella]